MRSEEEGKGGALTLAWVSKMPDRKRGRRRRCFALQSLGEKRNATQEGKGGEGGGDAHPLAPFEGKKDESAFEVGRRKEKEGKKEGGNHLLIRNEDLGGKKKKESNSVRKRGPLRPKGEKGCMPSEGERGGRKFPTCCFAEGERKAQRSLYELF